MIPTFQLQSKRYHKKYEKLRRKAVEQDAREEQVKFKKKGKGQWDLMRSMEKRGQGKPLIALRRKEKEDRKAASNVPAESSEEWDTAFINHFLSNCTTLDERGITSFIKNGFEGIHLIRTGISQLESKGLSSVNTAKLSDSITEWIQEKQEELASLNEDKKPVQQEQIMSAHHSSTESDRGQSGPDSVDVYGGGGDKKDSSEDA